MDSPDEFCAQEGTNGVIDRETERSDSARLDRPVTAGELVECLDTLRRVCGIVLGSVHDEATAGLDAAIADTYDPLEKR